jgi:hypothetical protein
MDDPFLRFSKASATLLVRDFSTTALLLHGQFHDLLYHCQAGFNAVSRVTRPFDLFPLNFHSELIVFIASALHPLTSQKGT